MAILSNINGKFAVDSTGAVQFSGAAGTSGYILKSNGTGSAPTWVDGSTVIGGPYLPLSGGTLTGATATASGISFTVGGVLTGTSATFTSTISAVGASTFTLNDGIFIKAVNGTNNVAATNVWGYGLYEGTSKLGEISLVRDGTSAQMYIGTTGANQQLRIGAGNKSEAIRITAAGNVGIGTGTPDTKLNVGSGGVIRIDSDSTGANNFLEYYYSASYIQGLAAEGDRGLRMFSQTGDSSAKLTFYTEGSERMRITSDGMVGIGMTPGTAGGSTYMLQMYNSGSQCFLAIGNGTSGNGPTNGLVIGNDTGNVWIVNREATPMIFATSDVERMRIHSNGRVSIGSTTASANTLTLAGPAVELDIHNTSGKRWRLNADTSGNLRFEDKTGGTEVMRFASSTDVLIGNTVVNPASGFSNQRGFGYDNSTGNLQIASTSGNAFVVGRNEASDGTIIELRKESNIVGALGSNTTSGQMLLDISGSSSNGNIRFVTNGAEVMRMTSAYKVGIGTASPTATLQVGGGSANVLQKIWGSGTAGIQIFTNSPSTGTKIIALEQYFSNEGYLGLYYNGTEKVRFRANDNSFINGGNLGIGTTAPGHALTIEGNSQGIDLRGGNNRIYFTGYRALEGATNGSTLQVGEGYTSTKIDSTYCGVNVSPSGFAALEIENPNSTSYSLYADYIDTNSSYGVMKIILTGASTSPSYVDWWYGATQTGAVVTTGSSTQYLTSSDYRLKENIVPMSNAIDRVMQLKPSRFNFIGHENIVDGLIAHEVAEVVPEAVNGEKDGLRDDGTPKYQGIDEGKLVPLLIGAIQELEARVKELENK